MLCKVPAMNGGEGIVGRCGRLLTCAFVILVLAGLGGSAADAAISSRPDSTYVTNGPVYSVARSADTIYLGGHFDQVGPRTGPWVSISASSGRVDVTLPQVSGGGAVVSAVAADGSGGFYIGGDFTHVGGVARNDAAHVRGDGIVDPAWDPNPNGQVLALALSGSTVYMGGKLTAVNGSVERIGAAAVDATTGVATGWNPDVTGGYVEALAVSGPTVYIGGSFNVVNGKFRFFAAAVDAATGAATGWDPDLNEKVAGPGGVHSLTVAGSTVYLGGEFSTVNKSLTARNNLAAVDAASATVTGWNPNANGPVDVITMSGSAIYVGGSFTKIGATARNNAASVDTSGVVAAWNPNPNGRVRALQPSGATVYLGGDFHGTNSVAGSSAARNHLAAVDGSSGLATPWDPNANNAVDALAVSGTTVVAGGVFSSLAGQTRNNAAALSAADGSLTAWDPNVAGLGSPIVYALAVSGSTVYLGGSFFGANSINGLFTRDGVAAVDATSAAATIWNPDVKGDVFALAASGGIIYIGGEFSTVNGLSTVRSNVAAADATTGSVTNWDPNVNGRVQALAASSSTVYIGGSFTTVNQFKSPQPRNHAAAVDATAGEAMSWNPNVSGAVGALAVSGSTVYLGGVFNGANAVNGTQTRNYAAAVDASTGAVTPWNANLNSPIISGGTVYSLALSGQTVYLGGSFKGPTALNGSLERSGLAEVDATTGSGTTWNPLPSRGGGFGREAGTIRALAADGAGGVVVGGEFEAFDSDVAQGIASFSVPPVSVVSPAVSGAPVVGQTLACSQGGWGGTTPQSYVYQWLRGEGAITGASGSSYTVSGADAGQQLACRVTAGNLGGQQSATSASLGVPAPSITSPGTLVKAFPTSAPVLSRLRLTPSRFRAATSGASIAAKHKLKGPKPGTVISYTDSVAATTTFTVAHKVAGVRSGHRCRALRGKAPKHSSRCTLVVAVGRSFRRIDRIGRNSFRFTGRVGRRLAPGTYTIEAVARNAGGRSRAVTAQFQIRP
jgi:hypothetical protein